MEAVLEKMRLHLDELVEGEWALHELADILNNWVLDFMVLCANEQAYRGNESADLLADHALARSKLGPERLDRIPVDGLPVHLDSCPPYQSSIEQSNRMVHRVVVEAEPLRGLKQRPDRLPPVLQIFGFRIVGDKCTRHFLGVDCLMRSLVLFEGPQDAQEVEVWPKLQLWMVLDRLAEDLRSTAELLLGLTFALQDHQETSAILAIRRDELLARRGYIGASAGALGKLETSWESLWPHLDLFADVAEKKAARGA